MNSWIWRQLNNVTTIAARELRANLSPCKASLSLSVGVLVGFSPFYGLHTIIIIPVALLFRLNRPLALAGTGVSIPPMVPVWIAAGVVAGKLLVPLWFVNRLVTVLSEGIPFGLFDRLINFSFIFARKVLPDTLWQKMGIASGQEMVAGFFQWGLGCSAFAVVCAGSMMAVTYPVFKRLSVLRQKKMNNMQSVQ